MPTEIISFQPSAGRNHTTLTSWAGDAVFPVTPVSGDQVEFPASLTVGADGAVTGDVGTYTLRLVDASTGTVYGVSYEIAEAEPEPGEPGTATASFVLSAPDNHAVATLADGFDTYLFQHWPIGEPVAGWQFVYPTANNTSINQLGELQTDNVPPFELDMWAVDPSGTWHAIKLGYLANGVVTLTFNDPVANCVYDGSLESALTSILNVRNARRR